MTYRWLQIADDVCRYVANDAKNTIAAEITKCDRTKWQIAMRDTDGAMIELPEFCERLSVAQLVVEVSSAVRRVEILTLAPLDRPRPAHNWPCRSYQVVRKTPR
jgi:hypothetical protein